MSYTADELLVLSTDFEEMAVGSLKKTAKAKEKKKNKSKKKPPFWMRNNNFGNNFRDRSSDKSSDKSSNDGSSDGSDDDGDDGGDDDSAKDKKKVFPFWLKKKDKKSTDKSGVRSSSGFSSNIKYSNKAAPSAHIRSWDPAAKGTEPSQEPSINHVGGNVGTDRKATDTKAGVGVDAPSHKATEKDSNKAKDKDPAKAKENGGSGNSPSDVRSPTSSEVRSPTSTSTEVRSPTSTSTEAYTADNFTATVTGGAGKGATTVNITPPPTPKTKTNPNTPKDNAEDTHSARARAEYYQALKFLHSGR